LSDTEARDRAVRENAALLTYAQQRVLSGDIEDAAAVILVAGRVLQRATRR
jgi:hypothetical protein